MQLAKSGKVYFLGIGGTGMAAVAGLMQEAGFKVTGSDAGVYPPMSDMLAELGITVRSPYKASNLAEENPDVVVVANVLSRGNEELESAITRDLPYTSFPKLLGDIILAKRTSIVVAGTHGKTTTTSLAAHVLEQLGANPGFIIGGIARNFKRSFRLGQGQMFVIEGDEYDTAFFDKGPKFLHYRPSYAILNNLEFDHADIYPNVEAIEAQFAKLIDLVPERHRIIANCDDPGLAKLLRRLGVWEQVTKVSTLGQTSDAEVVVTLAQPAPTPAGKAPAWDGRIKTRHHGEISISTSLAGAHNMANIAQVIALLEVAHRDQRLPSLSMSKVATAIRNFAGVARRLDLLASRQSIDVYEDFAHHPTAVRVVLESFRKQYPNKRLLVAFEPRSASQRRNVFQDDFAKALSLADLVFIGECPTDKRIPDDQRMDTSAMQRTIGAKAKSFSTNQDLLADVQKTVKAGDAVIFMSSGSFSGIQHQLAKGL